MNGATLYRKVLGFGWSLLVMAACQTSGLRDSAPREPVQSAALSDSVDFTILQLNDVYEISAVEGGRRGGLARVATLRQRLLAENPRVFTLLAGDFLSPSAMGATEINGEAVAGQQMIEALNAVGVDYVVFGNHEFDVSHKQLLKRIKESHFRWLGSNVFDASMHLFPGAFENALMTVNNPAGKGIRVAMFGLCIDMAKKPHVRYRAPLAVAQEEVAKLTSADVVVAMTHLDAETDKALAAAAPRIDVILGGHEHEAMALKAGPKPTSIYKADANARTVYVHRFHYNLVTKALVIRSELVKVDASIPEEPATKAVVDRWTKAVFDALKASGTNPEAVVGRTAEALNGFESAVRNHPTNLTALLAQAALEAEPEAQAVIYGGGSIRVDDLIPAGPITNYDIVRIFPFGGRMILVTIRGDTLRRVLEVGRANKGTGGYLQTGNFDQDASGAWRIKGKRLDPKVTYKVLFNDFLLTGLERGLSFLDLAKQSNRIIKIRDSQDVRRSLAQKLKRSEGA